MSVTMSLIGYKSKDSDLYKKHANVLKACLEADITELPKETASFFNSEDVEEYLLDEILEIEIPIEEYQKFGEEGYIIKVKDIPKECDIIKFYLS